jgi:hypothetical protein
LNEIFLLSDMNAPVAAELRTLGVRIRFRSEVGSIGMSTILRGTTEWTPDLSRKVDEVLIRHGLRELREGVWGPPDTDQDSLRRWEESAREAAEYGDIYDTITEHPDWGDQEVADSCGVGADEVAYYRSEWDR